MTVTAKPQTPLSKEKMLDRILRMERNLKYTWHRLSPEEKHDGAVVMETITRLKALIQSGEFDMNNGDGKKGTIAQMQNFILTGKGEPSEVGG